MGGHGSGLSRQATEAVEILLAALLRDDQDDVADAVRELDIAHRAGLSKMSGKKVRGLLEKASRSLAFDVEDARAKPADHLGDVKVTLSNGESRWIEVKAQTKKEKFAEIVQADYVRDGTDFLRRLDVDSREFHLRIDDELRIALELDKSMKSLSNWSLESLWMADLALLDTETKKKNARVMNPSELHSFLGKKYLLHLCMNGVRYVRMDNLGPIRAITEGAKVFSNIKTNSGSAAAVQVSAGRMPSHANTDFTYHVGFSNSNAAGRHKLHEVSWKSSRDVETFNA